MDIPALEKLARLLRYYILISTTEAGSGHATSALSAVELSTVLFFKHYRFDLENPQNPGNDRFILSKGHASPLLYALYAAAGKLTEEEIRKFRKMDSPLEGHPSKRFPYTEIPTGSLGQGLSAGIGMALAMKTGVAEVASKNFDPSSVSLAEGSHPSAGFQARSQSEAGQNFSSSPQQPRVFVLLGDGEVAEGQVWEAVQLAAYYKLNNVIALIDVNRLGQSQQTMLGHDLASYERRFSAFGWRTYVVGDGHDLGQIDTALSQAIKGGETATSPACLLAKTIKGRGVSFLEDKNGWHGKALSQEEYQKALVELGEVDKKIKGVIQKPIQGVKVGAAEVAPNLRRGSPPHLPAPPSYAVSEPIATRKAFGQALVRLGQVYPELVVLDGDVKNSTYTELFAKNYPERFFEMFIAEQNLVGTALGLAARGKLPVVATFACFLTRAGDQLRMAGLSNQHIIICGSHAGVSIGEDGPSQMGLEDLALFRAINGSTVLYPADPYQTEKLVEEALKKPSGIVYLRTTRPATPVIYKPDEDFPLGGSKTFQPSGFAEVASKNFAPSSVSLAEGSHPSAGFHFSNSPQNLIATVVAAGITLHEALKAQKMLASEGISIRVIDCYSVKPIDTEALKKASEEIRAMIVVEDHYPEGGLGEAVKSALANSPKAPIIHLAVYKTPRSGKPEELLDYEGISANDIAETVKSIR